jgi:hypothetical protein
VEAEREDEPAQERGRWRSGGNSDYFGAGQGSRRLGRLLDLETQAEPNLSQRYVRQRVARALGCVRVYERELGAQLVVAVATEGWEPLGLPARVASQGMPLPGASNGMNGSRRNG